MHRKSIIVHGGFCMFYCIGEFGVVYRAKLLRKQGRSDPGFVAVKTMRGMLQLSNKSMHGKVGLYFCKPLIYLQLKSVHF